MTKNNSEGKPYYTQRNNRLKPNGACNVTAMIAALVAAGYAVGALATEQYPQPEDALMHFILSDKRVDAYWRRIDPIGRCAPNEWHPVLAYGTNLFLRERGVVGNDTEPVAWSEQHTVREIVQVIEGGGAAVLSGVFLAEGKQTIGHVVAAVGFKTDENGRLTHFIIDDSWGDYRTEYKNRNGNDIEMPLEDFQTKIRHCGTDCKLAHLVRKAVAK
ncbi:MAG: hypothetical protein IJS09_04285 [Treponema sp.]|nr:hypothetical protein [Treponema sp.]